MKKVAVITAAVAMFAAPAPALAGDLAGTVRDSVAQPVAGAQVVIPALGLSTTTDADGAYRFEGLAAGEYSIAVELAADARQHVNATVPETGEATRNVFLYSRAALDHARDGVNPVEAMLADALMAQAWEAASEITATTDLSAAEVLTDFAG